MSTQDNVDLTDKALQYYKIQKGAKLYLTHSTEKITEDILKEGSAYELIPENRPVIEYYDIDYEPFIRTDTDNFIKALLSEFIAERNTYYSPTLTIDDFCVAYRISTKNFARKLGIRLYSKKTYFENNAEQKQAVKNFKFSLDLSVYNKNSILNLLGSYKYGKNILLEKWQHSTFDFIDTIVTRFDFNGFTKVEYTPTQCTLTPSKNIPADIHPLIYEFLQEHPEFEVDPTNIQKFNRVASSRCFLHPTEEKTHDRDGAWWVLSPDGDVLVFCYRHNACKKLVPFLDRVKETPSQNFKWRNLNIDTKYIGDISQKMQDEPSCKIDEFDFPGVAPPVDLLVLTCPLGSGKTKSILDYTADNRTVLFIIHRVSLCQDLMEKYGQKYGFDSYLDRLWGANKLFVCVNSLCYVKNPLLYSTIVIDELGSVLKQFDMKSFPKKSMEVFYKILIQHKKIIAMDGTLSDSDLKFFSNIVNPSIPLRINYIYDNLTEKNLEIVQSLDELAERFSLDVSNGKNILFPFSCSLIKIQAFIKSCGVYEIPHLIIHKDNSGAEVMDHTHWESFQIVFYSPTIAEGVSYEGAHFDKIYGFFSQASCLPRTVAQQIGRGRMVTEMCIYVDDAMKQNEISSFGLSFHKFISTCVGEDNAGSTLADFSYDLWVKNNTESVADYKAFKSTLIDALKKNNYTVTTIDKKDTVEGFRQKFYASVNECQATFDQNICDAPEISKEDYKRLSEGERSEAEAFAVKKYELKNMYLLCDDLDEETIPYFKHAYTVNTLRHAFSLELDQMSGNADLQINKHLTSRIEKQKQGYTSSKIFADQKSYLKTVAGKILFLNTLLQKIGFSHLFDTKQVKLDQPMLLNYLKQKNHIHTLARCAHFGIKKACEYLEKNNAVKLIGVLDMALNQYFLKLVHLGAGEWVINPEMPLNTFTSNIPMIFNCDSIKGIHVEHFKKFFQTQTASISGDMDQCAKCGKEMRKDNLKKHLEICANKPEVKSKDKIACPECGKEMRKDNLKKHSTVCKKK
jgi:DNA-directed RNA polymerase subunit RPC12/RpoP